MKRKKNAIALMITLFFIIAITLSLGIGLKYLNDSSEKVTEEEFTLQCNMFLYDFMNILKTSKDVALIKSPDTLALFLSQAAFIPLSEGDYNFQIQIESARSKINPIIFNSKERFQDLESYLARYNITSDYIYILKDLMGGIKEDLSYNTEIFNDNPNLFRDYIVSPKHLEEINKFYIDKFGDKNIDNLKTGELFYTSSETNASNYKLDLNYVTPTVWELIIGCDEERARALTENGKGLYTTYQDLGLSKDENNSLSDFSNNIDFYEPIIKINILIEEKDHKANIQFEYNLESKKGSNFVFEV